MSDRDTLLADLNDQLRRLQNEMATGSSDAAGELSSVDQHPADSGSDLYERERTLGRINDLENRIREIEGGVAADASGVVPGGSSRDAAGDVTTPLDEPAPPPTDLVTIPMGAAPELDDPDQEADIDGPGAIYRDGRTNPDVGDGDIEEGSYRPA